VAERQREGAGEVELPSVQLQTWEVSVRYSLGHGEHPTSVSVLRDTDGVKPRSSKLEKAGMWKAELP